MYLTLIRDSRVLMSRRLTNLVVSEYWSFYTNRLFQTDETHGGFARMVDNKAGAIV